MLLAEALNERKRLLKAASEWRDRAVTLATRDEDEDDSTADLVEAQREMVLALNQWEQITRKIHTRNAVATLDDGTTLLDAILNRDKLVHKHQFLNVVLTAAVPEKHDRRIYGYDRRSKDDVKTIVQADAKALRAQVNEVAEEIRKLDIEIQKINWSVEL